MKTFNAKSEVVAFLSALEDMGLLSSHSNGWSPAGQYVLAHGEYDRPDYRPARYKDGWGIAKVPFFHCGTFCAPSRHRVAIDSRRDVYGQECKGEFHDHLEITPVE